MARPPLPLVRLPPNAVIHRFGTPPSAPRSSGLLRFGKQGWTINRESKQTDSRPSQTSLEEGTKKIERPQGWAVLGDAEGRRLAVETLLSRHRIYPPTPPPGPFPYIASLAPSPNSSNSSSDTSLTSSHKPIRHLAFARPPSTGEFTDFTARYGALLEEDKLSFRETLSSLEPSPSADDVERVAKLMKIDKLLDLPRVSLSSGQTRRARIASALLTRPVLLLLEDPMAGLDIPSRTEVSRLLGELNAGGGIRIVLVLRGKGGEVLPDWITDVAEVKNGDVWIGKREEYEASHREEVMRQKAQIEDIESENQSHQTTKRAGSGGEEGEALVKLDGVSVSYGEGTRQVLKDISWTIKEGEKWHLVGANGSGKTTLLSLILGHHPRSFSLPSSALELFSEPRRSIPTAHLRQMIGHTSPEIYASFPRGMGLSAYAAVGSGFEGVFSYRALDKQQKERVLDLLGQVMDLLQPNTQSTAASIGKSSSESNEARGTYDELRRIALRPFSHFTPPQQGLLLFLRAIVGCPRLLILDEPSQGLDEVIWERCKGILEKEWSDTEAGRKMGVVVVSHYEDEVPWKKGRGKVLKLDHGVATIA